MTKSVSNHISIEWITDHSDCDDCGPSYAEGAIVRVDGVEVVDLTPGASCYGGTHYTKEDVFRKIIESLGHTVEESETSTGDDFDSDWDD